jgi:hypothetical protein
MGTPTPVFQRLLAEGRFRPGLMLVPGAGRGHDAREFARHGFDVVAVDFAGEAANAMRERMHPDFPHEVLQEDFFGLSDEFDGTFDYVLEYTCYCAIDPERRAEYAAKVASVLKRRGKYIGLLFPTGGTDAARASMGPPFAVDAEELVRLMQGQGMILAEREIPPDTIKPRKGREELIVMLKS